MSNISTNLWQRQNLEEQRDASTMSQSPAAPTSPFNVPGADASAPQAASEAALLQRPALTEIERKLAAEEEANVGSFPQQRLPLSGLTSVQATVATPQHQPGLLQRWRAKGGVLGGIASALIFVVKLFWPIFVLIGKLKYLLLAGKILLTGGTMLLSAWVYSLRWGWAFGAGLVGLIFIHECGHALAARMKGIKTGIMVFIPMMGAFVTTKGFGRSLTQDAFIGIMGPLVGTLASAACALMFLPTQNPFWLALASWGFFINLFNLLPTPPLDGGWITPLFSPKLLAIGVIIAVIVGFRNPLIWLLLLTSLPRIIGGWKADPATEPYYQVATADKWKYGFAYLGLASFLGAGWWMLNNYMTSGHVLVM